MLASTLALPSALAHDRGFSTSELTVQDDGAVTGEFTFSAADLSRVHVDGDALAARGVVVRADDATCPATLGRFVETGGDGVEARVEFRCPPGAARIELAVELLADLGGNARNVARITHGSASAQAVLTPTSRVVALGAPRANLPQSTARSTSLFPWIVGAAVVALVAFVLRLRYRRST